MTFYYVQQPIFFCFDLAILHQRKHNHDVDQISFIQITKYGAVYNDGSLNMDAAHRASIAKGDQIASFIVDALWPGSEVVLNNGIILSRNTQGEVPPEVRVIVVTSVPVTATCDGGTHAHKKLWSPCPFRNVEVLPRSALEQGLGLSFEE